MLIELRVKILILTHFKPVFHIYIPWKDKKISGFQMSSRDKEIKYWLKMG